MRKAFEVFSGRPCVSEAPLLSGRTSLCFQDFAGFRMSRGFSLKRRFMLLSLNLLQTAYHRRTHMQRALLVSLVALAIRPAPTGRNPAELVQIVDSPSDVRFCPRLGEVSPGVVPTVPGFGPPLMAMLEATSLSGARTSTLQQTTQDWSLVRGIAYRCGPAGSGGKTSSFARKAEA